MAGHKTLSFLLLAVMLTFAAAARILEEDDDASGATTTAPGGAAVGTGPVPLPNSGPVPLPNSGSGPLPIPGSGPLPIPGSGPLPTAGSGPLPIPGSGPLPTAGSGPLPTGGAGPHATGPGAGAGPGIGGLGPDHTLTFFMHDILGGTNPTARAVTGAVANPAVSGQVAFAKPNGANLPVNNGVPNNNNNNGIVNNNNVPLLTGLGGIPANFINNNNGNNILNAFPGIANGQLPSGSTLQSLMFGTMTVIDDELTEGHELGSGLIGKAQGFYVASSVDGTSQTMAFTAMFEHGGYEDSISFFGVHRTVASESHLAIMGGTGKYVNVRGFAIVKTFAGTNAGQPQLAAGLETLLEITVYPTY